MTIQQNISLKPYNTFGLDVEAKYFAEFTSAEELKELLKHPIAQAEEKLILGGGSNMLLTQNFDGIVLRNRIAGIEIVEENAEFILLKSGAGVVWHDLVQFCIANNLAGVENLSLIPGTVGAAPMQNIGAYGVELKEVFEKLEAVKIATGETETFNHERCGFGYRQSIFKNEAKGHYIITHVYLKLKKQAAFNTSYGAIQSTLKEMNVQELTLQSVSEAVCRIRQSKLPDPAKIGNAGSFFKNPEIPEEQFTELQQRFPEIPHYPAAPGFVKVPAGWMIEKCGWKGKKLGHYGVHEHQALVLVNYGGAHGSQIKQLAYDIIDSVESKFGIKLEPEVNIY